MLKQKLLSNNKSKPDMVHVLIPSAIRQQVWLEYIGPQFNAKCTINWCSNKITPFSFHLAHNLPKKYGGKINIDNLRPICANCNLSMGHRYTINEWNKLSDNPSCCGCICM